MAATLHKFSQFLKMEDASNGAPTVWGIATLEQPDCDNEICMYEDSKPAYEAWSAAAAKRTAGAGQEVSLGNIRLQHGMEVGGKATKLEFDDQLKQIMLGSEPINDAVRTALKQGMYTGYSQGGSYAYRKCSQCDQAMPMQQGNNFCTKCKKNVPVNYALKSLSEVSYVDSPATGEGFEHVKANGSREIVKFQQKEAPMPKVAKTKEEMTALFNAYIDGKAEKAGFRKGLYTVSRLAELLQSISNVWESTIYERDMEGDASSVPEQLAEDLEGLIETFLAMAEEEAKELAAVTASKTTKGAPSMTPEEQEAQKKEQEALKAAKRSKASHFAKAATHHEKMRDAQQNLAELHTSLAESHKTCAAEIKKCMATTKPAKDASVASGAEGQPVHEALAAMVTLHTESASAHSKAAKGFSKCAKSDGAVGEAFHGMSKINDEEEHEKTVKAIKAEVEPADPVVKEAPKNDAQTEFAKAATAKADARLMEDESFIADLMKARRDQLMQSQLNITAEVQAIREKTVIPVGVSVSDVAKGVRVVPRDESKFELAATGTTDNFAGL